MTTTLHIRQEAVGAKKHRIRLTLKRPGMADIEAEATIAFAMPATEQEELRWYMEDYLQAAAAVEEVQVRQVEECMRRRGEELYKQVLAANMDTQAIWFAIREQLADLRIEIATGIAEAASIPWELMRDPRSASAIALRVQSFVRVQSNPSTGFVRVPRADGGRVRLLYVVCRPGGRDDVELRAVANRLLQDLGADLGRFEITALRPPTFERLQKVLADAKAAGRPFHIVHFDGHGIYEELSRTTWGAEWLKAINALMLGGDKGGKHGYLLFENPGSKENLRPVPGAELGKLLHDAGVPVLVLNACQSAMHEAVAGKKPAAGNVHDEVRAIGSLAQAVTDQGIPAVLGMRYSVYVVTAAQYIGQLYAALAQGRPFGQAASEGRKHLALNPDRWVGLEPRPLQDWFVPVVSEATPVRLLPPKAADAGLQLDERPELDPAQTNPALRRYVPDTGFVGRDETLLLLDRAFDEHPVLLLHAYAGQGKSATAVEFARWYARTGGLGPQPVVLLTSFETHTDLTDALNQIGQMFAPALQASGVEWHALNDNEARRRLVLQILRQVPVLWIWDNVEPVAGFPAGTESAWTPDEQAELADFLKQIKLDQATKARVLLTSRRDEQAWLGGVPHRIEMPRMRNTDAANLARSLGTERKITREEVAEWQPLLDYCHGNPLTLRVIVGQTIRTGLRGKARIEAFVEAVRSGEQAIEDADEKQGRDKSLGASLDYGFRHAFKDDELPIIALLHLFQGTLDMGVLAWMRDGEHALPELKDKTKEDLTSLLDRAHDCGLLTQLTTDDQTPIPGCYTIHPALPWFLRQLFDRYYDGQQGRSTTTTALRVWVEAFGKVGSCYHRYISEGNRAVSQFLALEEANLLNARRTARRHGWWHAVTSAMQGLCVLYEYQGRLSEWSRLVDEIAPDYCTPDNAPVPGREDQYILVMGYRIALAQDHARNLPQAAALAEKLVALLRQQAADGGFNSIHDLASSLGNLGGILLRQCDPTCIAAFEEAIRHFKTIGDTTGEATTHANLGSAYTQLPAIRNLDAGEAHYRRGLDALSGKDSLNRSKTLQAIGRVHHERFDESRRHAKPEETVFKHAQAAERYYLEAIHLCPATAITQLGPMHNHLGILYSSVGQFERAREHYEKCIQFAEQAGDRRDAPEARYNLAAMYLRTATRETTASRRRDLLERAHVYAQAALRDFQHYQGRASAEEAKAQQLLALIVQAMESLDDGKKTGKKGPTCEF